MEKLFDTPGYWAVIPADVRYDERIPPNAKLLYGEISALCNREGYCWAKNEYFAQLFGWAPTTVTRLLSGLRDAGYLSVEMVKTKVRHHQNPRPSLSTQESPHCPMWQPPATHGYQHLNCG